MKRRLHAEDPEFIQLRESLERAVKAVRPGGGAELSRDAEYRRLAEPYVFYCLCENMEPERRLLAGDALEGALLSLSEPERPDGGDAERSVLAGSTLAGLLFPLPPVGLMLKEAGEEAAAHEVFDQQTSLRRALRQWAERTRTDPFVAQCMRDAADHESVFHRAIMEADARLNGLRMKYEIQRHRPDRLSVERGSDGKAEIVVVSAWAHIADAFPADVVELFTQIATVELAIGRLTRAAEDINREVSRCVSEATERCFRLLAKMPRGRRRQFTEGRRIRPKLLAELIAAAASTDFTTEGQLAVYQKALPRRLRVLASDAAYERVRARVLGQKVHDASTVVAGPTAAGDRPGSGESQ